MLNVLLNTVRPSFEYEQRVLWVRKHSDDTETQGTYAVGFANAMSMQDMVRIEGVVLTGYGAHRTVTFTIGRATVDDDLRVSSRGQCGFESYGRTSVLSLETRGNHIAAVHATDPEASRRFSLAPSVNVGPELPAGSFVTDGSYTSALTSNESSGV